VAQSRVPVQVEDERGLLRIEGNKHHLDRLDPLLDVSNVVVIFLVPENRLNRLVTHRKEARNKHVVLRRMELEDNDPLLGVANNTELVEQALHLVFSDLGLVML